MTLFFDHYQTVRDSLPEALYPRDARDAAMAQFEELGLPGRRQETWRHTDIAAALKNFTPSSDAPDALPEARPFQEIDSHVMTFSNGCLEGSSSRGNGQGLVLDTLLRGLSQESRPAGSRPSGSRPSGSRPSGSRPSGSRPSGSRPSGSRPKGALECLTTALAQDGAWVHVSSGVRVHKPIQLLFLTSESGLALTYNQVVLEPDAHATVLECHLGHGPSFSGTALDIHLARGATLRHVRFQAEGDKAIHVSLPRVHLEEGAQYDFWLAARGAKLSRLQGAIRLCGSGARAQFRTVMRLAGKRHCDVTLQVSHEATECESLVDARSVLEEDARGVCQVRTTVWRGAQRTQARQSLKTLLLSAGARMHTQPALAVFADDVQCAHGATSGGFDEEVLFYLRTRGISQEEARELLMQAFIDEILESVPDKDIRRCAKAFVVSP